MDMFTIMPRLCAGAVLSGTALMQTPAACAADIAFGQYLSSECVTCHRADGQDKGIPSIVGWPQDQFVAVMQSYRSKERSNAVMQTIAGRMSDPEFAALAAYYESLKAK
jgi:cytochrome c